MTTKKRLIIIGAILGHFHCLLSNERFRHLLLHRGPGPLPGLRAGRDRTEYAPQRLRLLLRSLRCRQEPAGAAGTIAASEEGRDKRGPIRH